MSFVAYNAHALLPTLHDISLNDQLFLQLGMYHIRQELFSQHLAQMNAKYNSCLENPVTNPNSNQCKFIFKLSHILTTPANRVYLTVIQSL
jgi:hypothetical protein